MDEETITMEAIADVELNVSLPEIATVHAKQYDTARKVRVQLVMNNQHWSVPIGRSGEEIIHPMVSFKKSDGLGGFYDTVESTSSRFGGVGGFYDETELGETAVIIDENDRSVVYVWLDRQVLTTAGNVRVDIVFYHTITAVRLSTFSMNLIVEPASVTEADLSSSSYFNILAEQIKDVLEAKQNITGLTVEETVTLAAGSDATATVTGGPGSDPPSPYKLHFGIPQGPKGNTGTAAKPQGSPTFEYAQTTDGTTVPSTWQSTRPAPVSMQYNWTKITINWNNGGSTTFYSVSYNGLDGNGSTADRIIASDGTSVQAHLNTLETYNHTLIINTNVSSLPKTITNANIKASHYVCAAILGTPTAQTGAWTYTTANGSLTISGSVNTKNTPTTLRLILTIPEAVATSS